MADANFSTKDLSNDDRINQASMLYRAIAMSDILFYAGCAEVAV